MKNRKIILAIELFIYIATPVLCIIGMLMSQNLKQLLIFITMYATISIQGSLFAIGKLNGVANEDKKR